MVDEASGPPLSSPGPPSLERLRPVLSATLAIALLAAMAWAIWALYRGPVRRPEVPEIQGEVPPFSLTESRGVPVTLEDLRGKVWVADFIFTRCTTICPLLSAGMQRIQARLRGRGDARLVSISVDPEHDTPHVLDAYAERFGADRALWLFLTGEWMEIYRLVSGGFRLGLEREEPETVPVGELVTHSDRMVLVDRQGRIRGYYHGTEEEGISALLGDLEIVLEEE